MTQLPVWLEYGAGIATIFSGIIVSAAGLFFTYRQWKFAKDQPKRDLEAHRRAIKMAKRERLINDFAYILRHSVALKEYMLQQTITVEGEDPDILESNRLRRLHREAEGLTLAIARAQLEGLDKEVIKIGKEQFSAVRKFVTLNNLLSERIDKKDGSDLTFLSNSVKEAHDFAEKKCDEMEVALKKRLEELENP